MRTTYHGEIVAKLEEQYKLYVIKNLDEQDNSLLRYVTVTVLPNWNICNLDIGKKGYFECDYTVAGETYYHRASGNMEQYNYSACYLINFIEEKKENITKDFNF